MRVLKSLNCYYNDDKGKDVNEVIIFLLNILHNELRGDNKESVISQTVAFDQINKISCCQCGYTSRRAMTFNTFDLNIYKTYQCYQKTINIYDCLNNWQSSNYPKLYCYNCRDFTPRNRISIIGSTPKVFIFLLQRGVKFNQKNKKININFILEEKIDLSKYIEKGLLNIYELTGIVSILASEKKYISYCKSPIDHFWYYYNDTKVESISLSDIISFSNNQKIIPCILYYTKSEN
jgi:ubiquitin C-terminal hydrolase